MHRICNGGNPATILCQSAKVESRTMRGNFNLHFAERTVQGPPGQYGNLSMPSLIRCLLPLWHPCPRCKEQASEACRLRASLDDLGLRPILRTVNMRSSRFTNFQETSSRPTLPNLEAGNPPVRHFQNRLLVRTRYSSGPCACPNVSDGFICDVLAVRGRKTYKGLTDCVVGSLCLGTRCDPCTVRASTSVGKKFAYCVQYDGIL